MNKNQFMYTLQQSLTGLGQDAVTDILADFEEHFANGLARGKTEMEINEELGDPLEIAQQYRESTSENVHVNPVIQAYRYQHPDAPHPAAVSAGTVSPAAAASTAAAAAALTPTTAQPGYAASSAAPAGGPETAAGSGTRPGQKKYNDTALVAVILFNIFLGIPIWIGLYSTLFGMWVSAGGIGVAACVLFTAAILKAGITSLILALFGLAMTALTILAVILMVYLTKLLCQGLGYYIRWNKKLAAWGCQS